MSSSSSSSYFKVLKIEALKNKVNENEAQTLLARLADTCRPILVRKKSSSNYSHKMWFLMLSPLVSPNHR
jgi:hypothetical protein